MLKEVAFSGRSGVYFDVSFVHVPLLRSTKRDCCIKLNSVCETAGATLKACRKRNRPRM